MSAGRGPRFESRILDQALDEDLAHCTAAGRSAIEGTRLGGCVKLYIPQPAGRWGVVFAADVEDGKPVLVL